MNQSFETMLQNRLGLFVHFGLYSAFGGRYKGKPVDGFGEWIQRRAEIPIADYLEFGREHFAPSEDFAINLVRCAKAAGFKYILMTAKHHDGFCLFESEVTDYTTHALFGRDLCRELADACRAEGLGVGFYYSHTLDWHERDAAGNVALYDPSRKINNRNFWDYPDNNINFEKYFREKCLPQVKELLTNYGKLDLIWFDYPHDITKAQSAELRAFVKSYQPDCLINSRIGYGLCDYFSLGDNGLPTTVCKCPTECLITLNHTWGYKIDDGDYKSPRAVIEILCRALSTGATLLINVGPMSDGALTPESYELLSAIGEWCQTNREAIYGKIGANPFKTVFPWGYVTRGEDSLYLYVKEKRESVSISGIESSPVSVTLIGDGEALDYSYEDGRLLLKLKENDSPMPVYRVRFDSYPVVSEKIIIDSGKRTLNTPYASLIDKCSPEGGSSPIGQEMNIYERLDDRLSLNRLEITNRWENEREALLWEVEILESGEYDVEVICAEPNEESRCCPPDKSTAHALSVDSEKRGLPEGIKYSFNISATGSCNMRHVKSVGIFKLCRGTHRVILSKEESGLGLGVVEVRFNKLKG